MTNQQCKETINALAEAGAIMFAPNNIWKAAELTLFGLEKRGYTITRAEPALISDEKLREAVDWLKERIEGAESIGDPRPCKKAREHHAALETALSELADLRAKLKQFPSSNAGDVK